MKKKKILFDMDGTLLDTMGMWEKLLEDMLLYEKKLNYIEPMEIKEGTTVSYTLEYIDFLFKDKYKKEEIGGLINMYLRDFYSNKSLAKDFVKEKLSELHREGYEMYVATATDTSYAHIALDSNELKKYFKYIFTPNNVGYQKHDLRYYEYILESIGANPEETVFVDDVLYAVELAKKAGLKTIGVFDKYSRFKDKVKEIADYYLYDFRELKKEILI